MIREDSRNQKISESRTGTIMNPEKRTLNLLSSIFTETSPITNVAHKTGNNTADTTMLNLKENKL